MKLAKFIWYICCEVSENYMVPSLLP